MVYKRGKVWWYKFSFRGESIRESTKQTDKRIAEQMDRVARLGWRRTSGRERFKGRAQFGHGAGVEKPPGAEQQTAIR